MAVCVALGAYLGGKLSASGDAKRGVSAADFVPEYMYTENTIADLANPFDFPCEYCA